MVEALRRDNEYEPEGSSDTHSDAEPKNNITHIAGRAKQQVGHGMAKAGEEVERGKDELAGVLDKTARRLEPAEGEPDSTRTKMRLKAANGLESTATYLRTHNRNEIDRDALLYVRKHPFQAMGFVLILGVIIRRIIR
jgi:ElaB/YqjD/DUF883 family membrane-anchored ribosome-binding protein